MAVGGLGQPGGGAGERSCVWEGGGEMWIFVDETNIKIRKISGLPWEWGVEGPNVPPGHGNWRALVVAVGQKYPLGHATGSALP